MQKVVEAQDTELREPDESATVRALQCAPSYVTAAPVASTGTNVQPLACPPPLKGELNGPGSELGADRFRGQGALAQDLEGPRVLVVAEVDHRRRRAGQHAGIELDVGAAPDAGIDVLEAAR